MAWAIYIVYYTYHLLMTIYELVSNRKQDNRSRLRVTIRYDSRRETLKSLHPSSNRPPKK